MILLFLLLHQLLVLRASSSQSVNLLFQFHDPILSSSQLGQYCHIVMGKSIYLRIEVGLLALPASTGIVRLLKFGLDAINILLHKNALIIFTFILLLDCHDVLVQPDRIVGAQFGERVGRYCHR